MIDTAIDHAEQSLTRLILERHHQARLTGWQTTTAPDGQPLVSAQLVGPGAEAALTMLASVPEMFRPLEPGDLRPVVDYSVPGRTACVWRTGGVWVELWHPEPVPNAPVPVQGPSEPPVRGLLGGRLPFTRGRKETAA